MPALHGWNTQAHLRCRPAVPLTCEGVAAGDALCKDEHVWLQALKVLVPPPLAGAACTRLDLRGRKGGGQSGVLCCCLEGFACRLCTRLDLPGRQAGNGGRDLVQEAVATYLCCASLQQKSRWVRTQASRAPFPPGKLLPTSLLVWLRHVGFRFPSLSPQ